MTKSIRKDFFREIKKSFSRFISILLIVVLGVAFYSGIRSSMPAMRSTADAVYDAENLMDIRVVGTLGLTSKDLEEIKKVEGIKYVEGSFSMDFLCLSNSTETVTKVISMPEEINDIKITEGRYPEKYNECVVSKEFLEESGLKVGDFMTLVSGTEDAVFDTLASETYTIVGVCASSYYLNGDMGTSTIGDGIVDGLAVIPKEAFVTDVYTTIYLTVEDALELDCDSEEYQEKIDKVIEDVKALAEKRCDIRYSEVRAQSSEMLEDAKNDYYVAKTTVETELAEAYQEILDGEALLAEAEEKYSLIVNAQEELPLRKQQLAEAEAEIASGKAEVQRIEGELAESKAEYDALKAEYDTRVAAGTLVGQEKADVEDALELLRLTNQILEQQMTEKKAQIETAEKEVEEGKKTIAEVEQYLATGDGAQTLQDARVELQRGKEQYEIAKQDAVQELADAEKELAQAEYDINNMDVPVWYVLDRNSIESYISFTNDSESIGAIGTVFPIIFFIVAALVSLTTMTRMVEEQRTQIGTLKALGYSKLSIISKYILYALLATVFGSVIGVFLGEYTLPRIIVIAYSTVYYNLGDPVVNFNLEHGLTAALAATICTTFAAYASCAKELRAVPAQLMRPEAPKTGKRIFLENISAIWDRLNFAQKAAMRNLFRYKKRFFMTLFGVGGCMALLLVGFGIRDSISAMANNQYGEVFAYDGVLSVDATLTRAGRRAMINDIDDIAEVEGLVRANRTMIYGTSGSADNLDNEKNAYLVVPVDRTAFEGQEGYEPYVNLRERDTIGGDLELSQEGVIITEKYADLLGVQVGDSIFIRTDEADAFSKEVKVTGITENYIFNYIYMTSELYQSVYLTEPDINTLYIKTADATDMDDLSERLLKIKGINSVTMNSDELAELQTIINMLYFIIVIMILAAGVLAFIVLYNLNNINISERRRELATLKLLGFYDGETAAYVFRENIVLTILGTLLGIVLGIVLHRFVMITVETDVYMFGRDLKLISIVLSSLLTIVFAVIVNFVMYFKLKKIDMVESLKSVE